MEVRTLAQLVEFINERDEWSLDVSDIIESNGWQDITGEERGVCLDTTGNEMVVINDKGQAEISYDPKSWYGIQDSLEYEIIKTGFRYNDNGDGTFDVCYDHAQDVYFSEINKHHVARVREDENTYYIIGEGDSCEGEYYKNEWTFADALKNQCGDF